MAEFLIYKGPHWMDKLRPAELEERLKDPYFAHKYEARYRPGDIVQVYLDGECIEPVSPNSKMRIVKVPGLLMSERDAKELSEGGREVVDDSVKDKNGESKSFPTMRRRYSIDLNGVGDELVREDFDQRITDKELVR